MNHRSIFTSITSYTPTPYVNPQENFLTELFAWIINSVPMFGLEYIRMLLKRMDVDNTIIEKDASISAKTQITVTAGHIDMLIYTDMGINFVCEHKIDSELSDDQIQKYMDCTKQLDGEGKYCSVLLTKDKWQHTQKADVSIIWRDVDELISAIIDNYDENSADRFILEQFSLFLKEKGIGRIEPMDADYFKDSYVKEKENVSNAENKLVELFNNLAQVDWKSVVPELNDFKICDKYQPTYEVRCEGPRWGHIGIRFYKEWIPSIFAGVMYDGRDHKLEFSDKNKGPDLVILIDVDSKKNAEFNSYEWTQRMKARLLDDHTPFTRFVSDPKNPWRLAVLQRPFYDVIKDCETFDEQKERVMQAIIEGIILFIKDSYE